MSSPLQFPHDLHRNPVLNVKSARMRVPRVERAGEVGSVKCWRVNGSLKIHLKFHMVQEELKRPLILLISPGRPKRHQRPTIVRDEGWGESGSWPFAWRYAIWMIGVKGEHLSSRVEREP